MLPGKEFPEKKDPPEVFHAKDTETRSGRQEKDFQGTLGASLREGFPEVVRFASLRLCVNSRGKE
jgi:hypothetical protein